MQSCVVQSVRTQETVPLLKAAKRVVLLTGTPALSRPKELFSQLTALAPSAKLKMKDFGERYCQCDRYRPYGGQYDGKAHHLLLSLYYLHFENIPARTLCSCWYAFIWWTVYQNILFICIGKTCTLCSSCAAPLLCWSGADVGTHNGP